MKSNGPQKVTSPHNPTLKAVRALRHRKQRLREGVLLLEGPRLLREALATATPLRLVIFTPEFGRTATGLLDQAAVAPGRPRLLEVPAPVLAELADTETPQGVMAVAEAPVHRLEQVIGPRGLVLVLDRLQDPGNLGTAVRSAAAAGATGVVLTRGCVDPFAAKAVRASAGAVLRVPLVEGVAPAELAAACGEAGMRIGVTAAGGGQSLYETDLHLPLALVVGNEGGGVSDELARAAAVMLKIPLACGVESLNAAVAASLCLFEVRRRGGGLE